MSQCVNFAGKFSTLLLLGLVACGDGSSTSNGNPGSAPGFQTGPGYNQPGYQSYQNNPSGALCPNPIDMEGRDQSGRSLIRDVSELKRFLNRSSRYFIADAVFHEERRNQSLDGKAYRSAIIYMSRSRNGNTLQDIENAQVILQCLQMGPQFNGVRISEEAFDQFDPNQSRCNSKVSFNFQARSSQDQNNRIRETLSRNGSLACFNDRNRRYQDSEFANEWNDTIYFVRDDGSFEVRTRKTERERGEIVVQTSAIHYIYR